MERSPALLLCGLAGLALSGCHKDGSIQVSWVFDDGAGGKQSAADGCGQHGVDSILISSFDTGSDTDQVQALCAPGVVTRPVPAGTWTVVVQALDPQGVLIQAEAGVAPQTDAGMAPQAEAGAAPQTDAGVASPGFHLSQTQAGVVVADDGPPVPVAVTFTPLPACMDGVDNDGDGRVDLDDPDCANDPYGTHE
jgi:hypothetical protein